MAKKQIPARAEGWKFNGRAGIFHVWHAGKNDYRVTAGAAGAVIATRDQFGLAYSYASRQYGMARFEKAEEFQPS